MASTMPLFIVLFIPLIFGLDEIYSWVKPENHDFTEVEKHHLHNKHIPELPFFLVRSAGYLLIATLISQRLFNLSVKQDSASASDAATILGKLRKTGTGALPIYALAITFAAFDWLMTLNPLWFSTIFGVYYFAGSFVSILACLIIVTSKATKKNEFGAFITPSTPTTWAS